MAFNIKHPSLLSFIISIIALVIAIAATQDNKVSTTELCKKMGGVLQGENCTWPKGDTAPSATEFKDIGCPENEYLAGITKDQQPVCRPLKLSMTSEEDKKTTENTPHEFIGGWKMNGICNVDSSGKVMANCEVPSPESVMKCESDVKPVFFAMAEVRATIPVPCLEKASRCYIDDQEPGKEHKVVRSYLLCDTYKINYFRLPSTK